MKIFAHRGASIDAPDNSPESVAKALALGADGIELDCLMTADSVPVAAHDDDLRKVQKGPGWVREKTWREVKELGLPSLTELLQMIRPASASVILDLKAQPGWMRRGPQIIAGLALEILPPERILLSSFSFRHLSVLKKHFPEVPRGLILANPLFRLVPPSVFDRLFGLRSVHLGLRGLKPSEVARWQRHGLKVYAWVANCEAEWQRCREWNVDGLFTDDPKGAIAVLRQTDGG